MTIQNNDIQAAKRSLRGLALGDSLGAFAQLLNLCGPSLGISGPLEPKLLLQRVMPYTDDTAEAIVLVEHLLARREVSQDALAVSLGEEYLANPTRGYGLHTQQLLAAVACGADWRVVAGGMFKGAGSFGNGSAMRVAPLGAFFGGRDFDWIATQARRSSEVTHTHADAVEGAVAVALAAASFAGSGTSDEPLEPGRFFDSILAQLRDGALHDAVAMAAALPSEVKAKRAGELLGVGEQISALDTVPLVLWFAAHHHGDPAEAIWSIVNLGGDCDTTAAILGGILGSAPGSLTWMNTIPGNFEAVPVNLQA